MIPSYTNPLDLNRYSYVLNNPIKLTDPTGHKCVGKEGECEGENGKKGQGFGVKTPKPKKKGTGDCRGFSCHGVQTLRSSGPTIGTPQNLGAQLSGIWVGGGTPNHYGVMGLIPEREGDHAYWAGVNAGLGYQNTYSIEFYENGAQIHFTETYSLSENTQFTEIESAGSMLTVKTSDGTMGEVPLGEFNATGKEIKRTTSVTVYGAYPEEMQVTILINMTNQTNVLSAPWTPFQFNNSPSTVWPGSPP